VHGRRHRIRDARRRAQSRPVAGDGAWGTAHLVGLRVLRTTGRPRVLRDSVRQPRYRTLNPIRWPRRQSPADDPDLSRRPATCPVHPCQYGRRRVRAARLPRNLVNTPGRRVDGRDDRPDDGYISSQQSALDDLGNVHHGPQVRRLAGPAATAQDAVRRCHYSRGIPGGGRTYVGADRLSGLPPGPRAATDAGRPDLRSRSQRRRRITPGAGHLVATRPDRGAQSARHASAGDPRVGRPARALVGRKGHCRGDSRCRTVAHPWHGSRPANGAVADDHRGNWEKCRPGRGRNASLLADGKRLILGCRAAPMPPIRSARRAGNRSGSIRRGRAHDRRSVRSRCSRRTRTA
jgi:hypothetical protein